MRRAFSHVDALATACILAILLALLLVTNSRTRGQTYQSGSLANLHEFAAITSSYCADNTDQFWSFTWPGGVLNQSTYQDLQDTQMDQDPVTVVACQAVDIMRRRDPTSPPTVMVLPPGWFPQLYCHLVLCDYLDTSTLLPFAISPGDRNRLLWSSNIAAFRQGAYRPNQPDTSFTGNWRWSFSSSYLLPPAFASPDVASATQATTTQGSNQGAWRIIPDIQQFHPGHRTLSQVAFPSHKVFLFDSAQWYGRRTPIYWGYAYARVPLVLVDGSAHVRPTGQSNAGFNPATPTSQSFTIITYEPQAWDLPADNGGGYCKGAFYYTRSGLRGRDFDGLEVPWVP